MISAGPFLRYVHKPSTDSEVDMGKDIIWNAEGRSQNAEVRIALEVNGACNGDENSHTKGRRDRCPPLTRSDRGLGARPAGRGLFARTDRRRAAVGLWRG